MRILYGVQTTGNGHISCSREVIRELKTMGHEVRVLLSGRERSSLWDMDAFEPFVAFQGLSFVAHRGKIKYFKTVCKSNFFKFYRDIASFNVTAYDVVITDYEPITARIARKHAIPSIGLGHHYAFYYNIPMAGGNALTRYILLNFAPVDYPLGLHWYHFNQSILPPIIPDSLKSNSPIIKEKILVYLPFEQQEEVESILRPLNKHHFFIYSYVNQPTDKKNIHVRPYSRSGFLGDLVECNGVICSAGFGLISEALHLGKKLLIKPLLGQIEQLSNALAISELELGSITKKLDCDLISNWLDYSAKVPMSYPNVARIIAHWIEDGCWEDMDSPVREAWNHSQIDFKRHQL